MIRIYFDTPFISEGFVLAGGRLLDFDFQKSTITDSDNPIFEDNCYADTGLWESVYAFHSGNFNYANGCLNFTGVCWLRALKNEYYGMETRNLLLKTRVKYNTLGASHAIFKILIHEQSQSLFDIPGAPYMGYLIIYDLVN